MSEKSLPPEIKGRTVPLEEIHSRLQAVSKQKLNFASEAQYQEYLGGMPYLIEDQNGKTTVVHDYTKGKGMIVTSHKSIEAHGSNTILLNHKTFEIAGILDRKHHGDECEIQSLKIGGQGYDRIST